MMRHRRVSWICGVAASIAFGANVVMAQSSGIQAIGPLSSEKADRVPCRATGDACFLGIDPTPAHFPDEVVRILERRTFRIA
jgi:hypothetical protein